MCAEEEVKSMHKYHSVNEGDGCGGVPRGFELWHFSVCSSLFRWLHLIVRLSD